MHTRLVTVRTGRMTWERSLQCFIKASPSSLACRIAKQGSGADCKPGVGTVLSNNISLPF